VACGCKKVQCLILVTMVSAAAVCVSPLQYGSATMLRHLSSCNIYHEGARYASKLSMSMCLALSTCMLHLTCETCTTSSSGSHFDCGVEISVVQEPVLMAGPFMSCAFQAGMILSFFRWSNWAMNISIVSVFIWKPARRSLVTFENQSCTK